MVITVGEERRGTETRGDGEEKKVTEREVLMEEYRYKLLKRENMRGEWAR